MYTVYKTTNIEFLIFYIGVHQTEDPNDKYLGSGNAIKAAIRKYGRNSFKKEILFVTENRTNAYNKEQELVNHTQKEIYNIN